MRERRILRRTADGKVTDFVPAGTAGVFSVLGMAVDPERRRLWATTTAYPPMAGYRAELEGQSALLAFDLESGRLVGRYEGTKEGKKGFNDVRVAKDGAVFVTDHEERPGTLYRLDPKTLKLEPFGDPNALGSPEGLTFSPDGRYLFVADYSYGIVRYEARHRQPSLPARPARRHPDRPRPSRVVWRRADRGAERQPAEFRRFACRCRRRAGPHPRRSRCWRRAIRSTATPPSASIVGNDLYYVATSQWGKLDDDESSCRRQRKLVEAIVLRLPLAKERLKNGRPRRSRARAARVEARQLAADLVEPAVQPELALVGRESRGSRTGRRRRIRGSGGC